MLDLWKAIAELAGDLSYERLDSAAKTVDSLAGPGDFHSRTSLFGPNVNATLWAQCVTAWELSPDVAPQAVAAALRTSARMKQARRGRQEIDLVWTGPSSTFVPMRSTEQVMLELIGRAKKTLFLVTFVNYGATTVIGALNAAVSRGVAVRLLLEGTMKTTSKLAETVPGASIFFWADDAKPPVSGKTPPTVHAKCVVADRAEALVTSANLTDHALNLNMELGVHIIGGRQPAQLENHLNALVQTKKIEPFG